MIQHVLKALEDHKLLVTKALHIVPSENSNSVETLDTKYLNRIIDEINEEIRNVNQMELRIAIVASMKSGKSTIINALIGENILPVSSNRMTIIPTEVIFKSEVKQSILILSNEVIHAISDIYQYIRTCLQINTSERNIIELFENESHLVALGSKIINEPNMRTLRNQETDPLQIQATLLLMNYLIRIQGVSKL